MGELLSRSSPTPPQELAGKGFIKRSPQRANGRSTQAGRLLSLPRAPRDHRNPGRSESWFSLVRTVRGRRSLQNVSVYPRTNKSILPFFVSAFLKGVRGEHFFSWKKFPPQSLKINKTQKGKPDWVFPFVLHLSEAVRLLFHHTKIYDKIRFGSEKNYFA